MTMEIREIGRCWKDVGEQRRGPVSLGINLATGSTNRLSPPISRQRTDSYLYCQVAAAAAPERGEDSSKKLWRIGTPVKQNAMQQDTFGGVGMRGSKHQRFPQAQVLSEAAALESHAPIQQHVTGNQLKKPGAMQTYILMPHISSAGLYKIWSFCS